MAKETVKAVRDAEIAAEKLIKESLEKKDAILSEARKKAGKILADMTDEAQKKAENDIKDAVRRSELIIEEAKKEAEKEVRQLIEMAKTKEEDAINLVISSVV